MNSLDDATLFEKIQQGDAGAFEALYDRYSRVVYSFALRSCNDSDLASEVTQDVFVRLWTTEARYQAERSQFRTWLLTITRRILYDKLRRRERQGVVVGIHGNVVEDPQLLPHVETQRVSFAQWFREDVEAALQSLQIEERTVVELAYFRQMTLSEIAKELNRPLGTVKTRLHRALKVLREAMPEWKGGLEG
ncbi:RNA polymerase sigma factor [Alicyclobacillus sp. ALC3]|uniref:RNA polymerase sigma factor n=1 Tax=Alicyclobacillus sp. ALC3 TaxID=2796143 RepID=UPI0023787A12|nr:sigma-70 family RNA polymerase sigma factor [Alicyclobacillus sp. ALC3]WDL98038.1 sigma-70 family RNA polymerase sigma factor [Alicyclobacillus sp. ALC3]